MSKRIFSKDPLRDRRAFDQMLLHEALDLVGRHVVIPRPLRIDEHRRSVAADAQTAGTRPLADVGASRKAHVLQLLLEPLPGFLSDFRRAALRARAQEHVLLDRADAKLLGDGVELVVLIAHDDIPESPAVRYS